MARAGSNEDGRHGRAYGVACACPSLPPRARRARTLDEIVTLANGSELSHNVRACAAAVRLEQDQLGAPVAVAGQAMYHQHHVGCAPVADQEAPHPGGILARGEHGMLGSGHARAMLCSLREGTLRPRRTTLACSTTTSIGRWSRPSHSSAVRAKRTLLLALATTASTCSTRSRKPARSLLEGRAATPSRGRRVRRGGVPVGTGNLSSCPSLGYAAYPAIANRNGSHTQKAGPAPSSKSKSR